MRNAIELAAVLRDKGLSDAKAYALIKLGKWSDLTADEQLQVMRYELEFESSDDPFGLMDAAIQERFDDE